ncbi:hypothetical protein CAPTEDRAFT_186256 [Capitella teleta]|uniref:Uncharacterized protein n=1 Tax=Capitella teleta TaxID=283909 RepID=R7TDD9_CAPTE|nr:hypothetical protein CAPTEDRAFT_186256 [Capitella teleta]|eukprot:ELT89081.1 hypothetical protein CAPTEDRAFT_186256 [Capitella teleta]
MKYGKMYEERALAEVAGALSEEVMPCKRSTSNGVRGAPDGVLASDRSLVEVKCPYNLLYVRGDLRRHYSSKRGGLIRVDPTTREASLNARNNKQAADYYHQCQCYLRQHPSSPRVVFAVWAPRARPSKVEARRLLEALTDNVLVSWNEKGALVDPRNKTTLQNTNVYNIIRNLYSINSPATAAHISRYEPTGLTFFVDRIMKLTADNGDIPKEVVDSIRNTGRIATGRWTERECNGRRYNLLKMFSTLTSFVPKLLAVFKSVEIFIAIMLTLGPISWSWFCYGYDWLASIGVTNRLTAYGLNTVRPLLEKIDGALPDEVVGAAQGAIVAYGDQIPMTVLQTVMAMTASTRLPSSHGRCTPFDDEGGDVDGCGVDCLVYICK